MTFRLELGKNQYQAFVSYAMETCDSFSLVFEKDTDNKASYVHQAIYTTLADFVLRQKNIGVHPDTKTHFEHSDIVFFKCDKQASNIFRPTGSAFEWDGDLLPEELCFYRKEKIWCACVCHEKRVIVVDATQNDMHFLANKKIDYWREI